MAVTPAQLLVDVRRLLDQRFPVGDVYADRYTDVEIEAALARALPRVQAQMVGRFGGSLTETLNLGSTPDGTLTLPEPALKLVSVSASVNGRTWKLQPQAPGQGRFTPGIGIQGFEVRWVRHWAQPVSSATAYAFGPLQAWEALIGQQLACVAAMDLVTITGTVPQALMMHAEGLEKDLLALPLRQNFRTLTLPLAFPNPQEWEASYWLMGPTEILVWWR